jgi:predicted transcriptional regulator
VATSVKIDGELKERLRRLAELRKRSSHWLMRDAIEQYVEREEGRESFKQEAIAAWTAYQETGRHLTGDETPAWLRTWGDEDETGDPVCHD